jgi:muramoyltetrapeptide carboxypeptidase
MRALGLNPIVGPHAHQRYGYLAGSDSDRVADFNWAIRDKHVHAIVALRGGYGTMRILDELDYDALRASPKVVMGFSDMTAVLNTIVRRSGVVAFHGPVAARESHYGTGTRAFIERAWMSRKPIGTLQSANTKTLHRGRANGRLAGGNLSLIASLCGTPFAIPTAGSLFVIEETEESPYRVDRMLTQLRLAGAFAGAHGVIFGAFNKMKADDGTLTIDQVLRDRIAAVSKPAIAGAPVGHIDEQWVLPLGLPATLDAGARTLTISEPAVV